MRAANALTRFQLYNEIPACLANSSPMLIVGLFIACD